MTQRCSWFYFSCVLFLSTGSNVSHCSISHSWSPDSRFFLTASLAPRMNVDNGFKIFKYNGIGPVVHVPLERAYDALWRPAAAGVYPNRPPSPKRPIAGEGGEHEKAVPVIPIVESAAAKPKAAPYRPPGSTGNLSNFMNRESGPPVGKIKKVEPNGKPAAYAPPSARQRVIPGMAPAQAQKKVVGAPPAATKAPNQPAPKQPAVAPAPKATPASAPAAPVAALTPAEVAQDKEKRAKNLRKKLKQLDEIKAKKTAGQTLLPEQVGIVILPPLSVEKGLLFLVFDTDCAVRD